MRKTPQRLWVRGALAGALILGVAGCGTDTEGESTPAATEMSVLTGSEPRSLNCAEVFPFDQMVSVAFVERLAPTDEDFQPTKDGLVDDWEQTTPTTWRLRTRDGITFSNGEPWNAEALKFSLDTLRTTEGSVTAYFQTITDVKVEDERQVTVTTAAPSNAVPALLAFGCGFPPDYYGKVGASGFGEKPIGTGPYVMQSWERGQQVTAARNENYWGGSPKLEQITWKFVPDQTTQVNLLTTGGGDVALNLPTERLKDVETAGFRVITTKSGNQQNIQMNTTHGQLASPELRKAVAMAIDRDAIVEVILGGNGVGADVTTKLFPDIFGTSGSSDIGFDKDAARKLVKAAGGAKVTLHYTVGRYPKDQDVAEAVAGMLSDVGFDVERDPLDGANFFAMKSDPGFDGLWIAAGAATLSHPDVLVNAFLGSRPAKQYCPGEEYDADGTAGLAAPTPDEAAAIYTRIEDRALNQDLCFVPLYVAKALTGTKEGVEIRRGYDTLIDYRTLGWN
ncbi:ABC transporter substrate-binding protein [Nocardioides sp. zg-ZUI104]|uniref:ABC transporter substrate-binding protein n=1 Tax=Nocardioides faecalis TaxID=2803858 RepID=UPI001BCE54E8|nr:ABC transporter substrate-binding protein [Nocardioides faecalis]MBS4754563.1 ABC transporter substrate-binding protein [Nocardioides faecalis]